MSKSPGAQDVELGTTFFPQSLCCHPTPQVEIHLLSIAILEQPQDESILTELSFVGELSL